MKYSLGFTAGALLHKEAMAYIAAIDSFEDYLAKKQMPSYLCVPTNSETSKKRLKSELDKRLLLLNVPYLSYLANAEAQEQKIILLLSICKCYPIISEFLIEVVYPKWKRFDNDLSTYDFTYFLSERLQDDEVDCISDRTRYKLSQVAIKMLKEVGIVDDGAIKQVIPSDELSALLQENADGWFLNCLLLAV